MKLTQILSSREVENLFYSSIVYEWEDDIHSSLNLEMIYKRTWMTRWYTRFFPLDKLYMLGKGNALEFRMNYGIGDYTYNFWKTSKVIPVIIDWYLKKELIPQFNKQFRKQPVVLITSREAYEVLKISGCQVHIAHWPLSLSDRYRISATTFFEKDYDLALVGAHQNPVLLKWLEKYCDGHPDFVYILTKKEGSHFCNFSSTGSFLGYNDTREEYMATIRRAKCCLYTTPGIDAVASHTNGYSQVTPRYLEMIASGCHVISRYAENADTEYYEMNSMTSNCRSYEDFEKSLDNARHSSVDMLQYASFLEKHYTSKRISQLLKILNEIK